MKRLLFALLAAGCSTTGEAPDPRPVIDLSPVSCGYKWFQSGYSPMIEIACEQDRSRFRAEKLALAEEHARTIANQRCPTTCAAIELEDTSKPLKLGVSAVASPEIR